MRCVLMVVVAWLAACSQSRCPEIESPEPVKEEKKAEDTGSAETKMGLGNPRFHACCDRVTRESEGVGCAEVDYLEDCKKVPAVCEEGGEPPKCNQLARIIHPDSVVRLCCASMEPREDGGTYLADCEELGKDDSIMSCTDRQRIFMTCESPVCDVKGCACRS